jgi:HEAT repeat protein
MPGVEGIVFALTLSTLLSSSTLIALALMRRQRRKKRFRETNELRRLSFPIISSLAAGALDLKLALQALAEIFPSGPGRAQVVERVLFDGTDPTWISVPVLRQLAMDFGLVELWEGRLLCPAKPFSWRQALSHPASALGSVRALYFMPRAQSAERLGLIGHAPSWRLLVRTLEDPHPEVRSAAALALGAIAEPRSFPALVEQLRNIGLTPSARLSIRQIQAPLACFPLRQARELVELLKHSHPRVRYLAAEVVRAMVDGSRGVGGETELPVLKAADFAPELVDLFLTRLVFDKNPEVRARTAPVVARLDDPRAASRLVSLLRDVQWFVRLHAVRAVAQPRLIILAEHVIPRLTDVNWRVREAAVRALLSFGPAEVQRLVNHYLITQDRYSLEQIAEELERLRLLPGQPGPYAHRNGWGETQVTERLIGLGS